MIYTPTIVPVTLNSGMVMGECETLATKRKEQTEHILSLKGKRLMSQSPSGRWFAGTITGVLQNMFGPMFVVQDDRDFEFTLYYEHGVRSVED